MALPIIGAVGTALGTAGKAVIPLVLGGIGGLPKMLKKIWENLTKEPAKAAALLNAVNDQSTAADVSRAAEVFGLYKDQVREEAETIEKAVEEEVEYFLKEITAMLQENGDALSRYQIRLSRIERKTRKILSKIEGRIEHEVSRRVSLDNPECKRILAMSSGSRKEEEMTKFFQNALEEALETVCDEIKEMLEEIFEELDEELPGAVERSREEAKRCSRELEQVDSENYVGKTENIMEEAAGIAASCDVVMGLMEG